MVDSCNRKAISEYLKGYCLCSKDTDIMEVTAWSNEEGFDVCIEKSTGSRMFSLTYGEWQLLQVLVNYKRSL